MLHASHLYFQKNGADLLHDLSFDLHAGEILAIIGPNGAGKTALLNALLGDIQLTSGDIKFAGLAMQRWSVATRAKHLAVLPQLSLLNFPYTVDEVVALGRTPHSTGIKTDQVIIQAAMTAMDIGYLRGRLYTQLSGGEKQRTQLARVMAQIWRGEDAEPRLLILDEPTSSLDLGHKQQLMQSVHQFSAQGVAVIMVEHDLTVVGNYAQKVLALQCGRSIAQGPVDEVLNQTMVQNLFGASVHLLVDPETGKKGISL
jgi:iron complex transport system ATP-binding protein